MDWFSYSAFGLIDYLYYCTVRLAWLPICVTIIRILWLQVWLKIQCTIQTVESVFLCLFRFAWMLFRYFISSPVHTCTTYSIFPESLINYILAPIDYIGHNPTWVDKNLSLWRILLEDKRTWIHWMKLHADNIYSSLMILHWFSSWQFNGQPTNLASWTSTVQRLRVRLLMRFVLL